MRAGVFASAHGRPDGMPGRIIGARAKGLPGGERGFLGIQIWGVRIGKLKHSVGSGGNNFELKGQTILGKGDHDDERNDGWAGTV